MLKENVVVARRGAGRPVDPNSVRSMLKGIAGKEDWLTLPVGGRSEPAPPWPLSAASDAEMVLWDRLWSSPQALVWEAHHLEFSVAMYVRTFFEAAEPGVPAALKTAALRMEGELGLSLPGMKSLNWRIGDANEPAPTAPAARQTSSGDWLKAVTVEGA
jgi:hypothetical protein